MLIFVIILLFIAASFILYVWNDKRCWPSDMVEFISLCLAVVGVVSFVVLLITCFCINITADAEYYSNIQRREALVYQLENNMYSNDNEVGKFELYSQVKEFNEDLAAGKAMYDNIWVGCLFPDFYEDIDYIPFEIASDSNGPTI